MIEAVFFDAMGTLMHLPQPVGHHYSVVAARHGIHAPEERLERAFRMAWKAMPARAATRRPRPDDDKGWWRELVGRVFGISAPGNVVPEECFEEIYNHFALPGVWQLYPETAGVLRTLAGKYRLGVISNFDGRLRPILENLGVLGYFETVTISSEAGADKPAAHIFECALASLNVPAAKALHAGDEPLLDWEAATAAGMHVYKLERPGNSLSGLEALLR